MVGNINVQQVAASQTDKEAAINAATLKLDLAMTDAATLDVSSSNVTISQDDWENNIYFLVSGATVAGRTVTTRQAKRLFAVQASASNTQDVDVVRGTTTVTLSPGEAAMLYTDGSANGMFVIASSVGTTTFTGLTDTPSSFSGQGGKAVAVNPGATGLEFTDFPEGGAGTGVALTRKHKGVFAYRDTAQSIPNVTWTAINLDKELYDTGYGGSPFHDNVTNNSRMTVPAGVTKVRLVGNVRLATDTVEANMGARITKNGSTYNGNPWSIVSKTTFNTVLAVPVDTGVIEVSSGDYFELEVYQGSGGSKNTDTTGNWLAMEVIETSTGTDLQSVAIAAMPRHKGCLLTLSVDQDIPSASTWTSINWDTEQYDTDDFHEGVTNPERITIPEGVSKVRLGFGVETNLVSAYSVTMRLLKNGSTVLGNGGQGGDSGFTNFVGSMHTPVIEVQPGDYFEAQVFQSQAGRDIVADTRSWFSVEVVEASPAYEVPTGFIAIQPKKKGAKVKRTSNFSVAHTTPAEVPWQSANYDTKVQPDDTGPQQRFWLGPDLTFTADNTTEELTATGHGMTTGEGPFMLSNSGGALPTGLSASTKYWAIVVDSNTIKLASSRANALAGTAIDFTTDGTGTHTLVRAKWLVIPAGVTKVVFTAGLKWATSAGGGTRAAWIANEDTGATFPVERVSASETTAIFFNMSSPVMDVAEGEMYSLFADQTSGVSLDVELGDFSFFSVEVAEESKPLTFPGVTVERPHIGCLVYPSSNKSIPGSTSTPIDFDAEIYDTGYRGTSFHDNVTNPERITIPAGITKVRLKALVTWDSSGTTYVANIFKNGAAVPGAGRNQENAGTETTNWRFNIASAVLEVVEGDYFTVEVTQTSGGSLNVLGGTGNNTWFAMEVVETEEAAFVPEQVEHFEIGTPTANSHLYMKVACRRFSLDDNFAGSHAYANNAPSGSTVFDVQVDGVSIGSITFAASSNTATFATSGSGEEIVDVGSRLEIVAPAGLNGISEIAFSLKAWRS